MCVCVCVVCCDSDHEYEDTRFVSLSEDMVGSLAASHDPQTQTLVLSVDLHRLVREGLITKLSRAHIMHTHHIVHIYIHTCSNPCQHTRS